MNELEPIEGRLAASIDKQVTGDLRVRTGGLIWASMTQVMEFAKLMAISGVAVPKHLRGNPGACLGIVTQAINWEMDPFAVANKSYAVSDRLAYESQLINAVILRRAPIVDRFTISYSGSGKTRRCTVAARIKSGAVLEYESPEMGTIPIQNSPLWKADPDQQLFYFASRAFCRRHFPDVLLGVYSRDELEGSAMGNSPPQQRKSLGEKLKAIAKEGGPRVIPAVSELADRFTPERGKPLPYELPPNDEPAHKDNRFYRQTPDAFAEEHDAETGELVEMKPEELREILKGPERLTSEEVKIVQDYLVGQEGGQPLKIEELDAETATVVLAGQLAARQGDAAYQKWWKRLNAPDAERATPHLEAIRAHLP